MNLIYKKTSFTFILLSVLLNTVIAQKSKYEIIDFQGNTKFSEILPSFYKEGLIFSSNRKTRKLIQRKDILTSKPFYNIFYQNGKKNVSIELLKPLIAKYNIGGLTFNKKEDFAFYSKNLKKSTLILKNLGIFTLKLSPSGVWEEDEEFPYNDSSYSITHPFLTKDGNMLYFASNMPGGYGGMDIYQSTKVNNKWSKPINLGDKINTDGNEVFPYLNDREILYFSSDKHKGLGGLDIFYAKMIKGKYQTPKNMGDPINSEKDDFGLIIRMNKEDLKMEGYFSSNRKLEKSDDIYYWKAAQEELKISGKFLDKETNVPIANLSIDIEDENGNVESVLTDGEGKYSFIVDKDAEYIISATLEDYLDYKNKIKTKGLDNKSILSSDILLEKDPYLLLKIEDSKTKETLKDISLIIKDNKTGKQLEAFSDEKGEVKSNLPNKYKLGEELDLTLQMKKEGYLSKSASLKGIITNGGKIEFPKEVSQNLSVLVKKEIGIDIAKDYNLKPIYYTYNSAEITPVSKLELDKIIAVMKDNPSVKIQIKSHTDSRGGDYYNLSLSDKRAKIVANYINSKLDGKVRIIGKGYGEKELINRCRNNVECTEEEHALNRRTEFLIIE